MSRACEDCIFFYPLRTIAESESGAAPTEGECHRNPPAFDPESDYLGVWPTVEADDWCGEHHFGTYKAEGFR